MPHVQYDYFSSFDQPTSGRVHSKDQPWNAFRSSNRNFVLWHSSLKVQLCPYLCVNRCCNFQQVIRQQFVKGCQPRRDIIYNAHLTTTQPWHDLAIRSKQNILNKLNSLVLAKNPKMILPLGFRNHETFRRENKFLCLLLQQ